MSCIGSVGNSSVEVCTKVSISPCSACSVLEEYSICTLSGRVSTIEGKLFLFIYFIIDPKMCTIHFILFVCRLIMNMISIFSHVWWCACYIYWELVVFPISFLLGIGCVPIRNYSGLKCVPIYNYWILVVYPMHLYYYRVLVACPINIL